MLKYPKKGSLTDLCKRREITVGSHTQWLPLGMFSQHDTKQRERCRGSPNGRHSIQAALLMLTADLGKAMTPLQSARRHQCLRRSAPAIALPCHQVLVAITICVQVGRWKASSLRGQQTQSSLYT